jgi:hypothetical protein
MKAVILLTPHNADVIDLKPTFLLKFSIFMQRLAGIPTQPL